MSPMGLISLNKSLTPAGFSANAGTGATARFVDTLERRAMERQAASAAGPDRP